MLILLYLFSLTWNHRHLWDFIDILMSTYIVYCPSQGEHIYILRCLLFPYGKNIQNPASWPVGNKECIVVHYCQYWENLILFSPPTVWHVVQQNFLFSSDCDSVLIGWRPPPPYVLFLSLSTLFLDIYFIFKISHVNGIIQCFSLHAWVYFGQHVFQFHFVANDRIFLSQNALQSTYILCTLFIGFLFSIHQLMNI